jgi:hypothetical protein
MKIKHNELQKLYKAYIMDRIPQSQKKCPPQKEIVNFFRLKLSENRKSKLINHITNCCYCAQEFEFILQTLREQENLSKEIGRLFCSKNKSKEIEKGIKKDSPQSAKKRWIFFPALSWKYVLPIFIVSIIISALIIFKKPEKTEFRDEHLYQISLIEPINGKYFKPSSVFNWTEIKNSAYYILEIFDETLYPVWESNKISKNHYALPEETVKKLIKNKTYFWMVTVYFSDGRKIESGLEEFIPIE